MGLTTGVLAGNWRSVFTLVPEVSIDLWTPMVLGVIAFSGHSVQAKQERFTSDPLKAIIVNIIVAIFGNFGYAGNFGVLTGLIAILAIIFQLPPGIVLFMADKADSNAAAQLRYLLEVDALCTTNKKRESKRMSKVNPRDLAAFAKKASAEQKEEEEEVVHY